MFVPWLVVACLLWFPAPVAAQAPPAAASLDTGISQVQEGDFFGAIVTLNAVVTQASMRPQDAPIVGRAHAFRAQAYIGLDQLERARAAVLLALKSDPNVATVGLSPGVIALLDEVRPSGAQDPEMTGDTAERVGNFQLAFDGYLKAYQELPEPLAPANDQRLREKIIRIVPKLAVTPPIPQQARDHATKAQDLVDAEAILGGGTGAASQQAAAELRRAIRLAPWWGDVTFRFATLLQKLQRGEEALANLTLYRLADPEGFAARAERAAPRDAAARPITPPPAKPAGPALIYIYWPEQQRGNGRQKLYCNGHQVAELQNNRFVMLKAAAGTHDLAFRDKHVSAVVDAGGEYYYRASIEGHWQFAMGPEIRLTAPDAATDEIRKQDVKANDARRTSSAECNAAPAAKRRGGLFTAPKKPR